MQDQMKQHGGSWAYVPRTSYPHGELVEAYLEHLSLECGPTVLMKCRGTSRHFVRWLYDHGIAPKDIDREVAGRFSRHCCTCHGYTQSALRRPAYMSRVRRFVRYLEDSGVIPTPTRDIDVGPPLQEYERRFVEAGYSALVTSLYVNEAEHFSCWLRDARISWADVDGDVVERFVDHLCICPLHRRRGRLAQSGTNRRRHATRAFLSFLSERGHLPQAEPVPLSEEEVMIAAYRDWVSDCVGATPHTVNGYIHEIGRWISVLGCDPSLYKPTTIRNIVLDQDSNRASASVAKTATVLRSFLRFLSFQGQVSPHLLAAVPSGPRHRRDKALPRYASPEKIEEIIASCRTETPTQIRDRAIILLLARLGLRAGDVGSLRFDAIDWVSATLLVSGKDRRPTRLPLPQDVGDAILEYIESTRPRVAEPRIFLRANAPYRPFKSASEIAGVVKRVLRRGRISGVPTGAHMFRHSLATSMLRSGGTLEAVGTVLRHRSPSVTSIYAKVDVPMLMSVAEPWPGEAPC